MMSDQVQAIHLLDEPPILIYPSLAVVLGVNKAIVFQQLHFLLNGQKTAKNRYNFVADEQGIERWWVYNSYKEWCEYFPWLSVSTLKGIFISLEGDKLVLSMQSVKNKSDRRKWYSIDYEVWAVFCHTIGQKMSHGSSDKKYPMVGQKMSNGYSKTSSKTSKEDLSPEGDGQTSKAKGQREANPVFDAVAQHIFGIEPSEVNGNGGRIGPIAAWLAGTSDGIRRGGKKEVVGFISRPAQPEHIKAFAVAWSGEHPGADMPLDFVKFVEAWRKWASQRKAAAKNTAAQPSPAIKELTPEERVALDEARRTIRPSWEKQGVHHE